METVNQFKERLDELNSSLEQFRNTLDHDLKYIDSYEDLGFKNIISNIGNFFSNSLKKFSSFMGIVSSDRDIEILPQFVKFKKDLALYNKLMLAHGADGARYYIECKNLRVPYMLSCKLTLDELTARLVSLMNGHSRTIREMLDHVDTEISKKLSDSEILKASRPYDKDECVVKCAKLVEDVKKFNADLIDLTHRDDTALVQDIIPSFSSLDTINQNMEYIKKSADAKLVYDIKKLSASLHTKVKLLATQIDNKESGFSKEGVKYLVDMLSVAAEGVTAIGTIYYVVTQAIYSYCALLRTLNEHK